MFEDVFKHQKLVPGTLAGYGFAKDGDAWSYETSIMDGEFNLHVCIDQSGDADTSLVEAETGEEYILYKTGAQGAYVGEVRLAIEEVLARIVASCYVPSAFKTDQSLMLIQYVRETYGDELEFLWEKFPDNAIWRRADNQKWYGAILTVVGSKIGLGTDKVVEIVDLRMDPAERDAVLAREHCYPGWHMNKNSWYTIVLDSGVSDEELKTRIDESHTLAGASKKML